MGLTGAGGGILAALVLVTGMHWSMRESACVALRAVASGDTVAVIDGFRHGLVRYKAALLMAICGLPMAYLGQQWAKALPQSFLMGGFSLFMLTFSWRFYTLSK